VTEYTIEWSHHSRGTTNLDAESEDEALSIFFDWYVNGPEGLLEDRSDWDTEIYPNG
jgi:hypothetical protein